MRTSFSSSKTYNCRDNAKCVEINAVNTTDNNRALNIDEPTINDIIDQHLIIELPNEYINDPIKR